ncbi:transposase family protein [Streptomyces sp. TG1A-8]|nr:transposase family protein [Streptomyces sp. TG1A-8]MDO0929904.1 transposase family protein [Streptomyces sp. TG1A-8]
MPSSRICAPVRTSVPDHELLVDLLGRIPDPRRRRGVRHPVGALIAVAVCVVMAGARGFTAVGEWTRDAEAVAMTRLGLERGSVDESTLRRPFARLDADRLDAVRGGLGRDADRAGRGPAGDRDRRQDREEALSRCWVWAAWRCVGAGRSVTPVICSQMVKRTVISAR